MSFDGIFLNSIKFDLYNKLVGGRVDKIYQPDKNEVVVTIRNNGENYKLLMTATSSSPRVQLTSVKHKNPEQPPMFCMLLRKHLTSARVTDIKQINFDRILEITFECKDELDTTVHKSLIIEIMGKHSNIIFVNTETSVVIDSAKRVAENVSSVRQIYPGIKYVLPPEQNKLNTLEVNKEMFLNSIECSNDGLLIYTFIYKNFIGLSPFISREICSLAGLNESTYIGELTAEQKDKVWTAFNFILSKVKSNDFSYNIYMDENSEQVGFYCLNMEHLKLKGKKEYVDPGSLLDDYYFQQDNQNKIYQRVASLIKSMNTKIDRDKKKVEKQRNELLTAEDREKFKIYGELILANLYKEPENNKLTVLNYYDPEQREISIPLDPKFNLTQNGQKYFKKYGKLKKAEEELQKLIDESLKEIQYLENILFSIESCENIDDLDEIYNELVAEGMTKRKSKVKKPKEFKPQFMKYISSGNHEILVGKNNLQNDMLTFKVAKKDDYWFHAKDMPGSHVIIRTNGDSLADEEYVEAAKVAAYYSKGKNSSVVEIDYTKKQNMKKPPNAKPGFVIYDTNYSMLVKPDISGIKTI